MYALHVHGNRGKSAVGGGDEPSAVGAVESSVGVYSSFGALPQLPGSPRSPRSGVASPRKAWRQSIDGRCMQAISLYLPDIYLTSRLS